MSRRNQAFTLIELLVVIAIIAILAAIIFPVFARAKNEAFKSSDMAAMNNIRNALLIYKVDQGAFPPAILGYATLYTPGNPATVVPASQLQGYLYPKRVNAIADFKPSNNRYPNTAVTRAVWPPQDPRPNGSAPIGDLDGNGLVSATDDLPGARQAFGPGDGCQRTIAAIGGGQPWVGANCTNPWANDGGAAFYNISGYDVTEVPITDVQFTGGRRMELRYSLFWTGFGTTTGGSNDDPRQLGYADPPDSTVLTWNSMFREWDGGRPINARRDIVITVGGAARMTASNDMFDRSWRHIP